MLKKEKSKCDKCLKCSLKIWSDFSVLSIFISHSVFQNLCSLCRFWNQLRRKSPTAAVLWLHHVTWSPSKPRNERPCWGSKGQSFTPLFCFRLLHLKGFLSFMLPILKRYPLLPDESKIFCCFVHRGKLICHHENLRCFALHFAASLCHIWLFNQEKCNNTATYAQECLVWSCAQFSSLFHVLFICHIFLTVSNGY